MSSLIRGYKKHLTPPHPGWQRTDPLDRGLIAEWRFAPATGLMLPDWSGRAWQGTLQNGPIWTTTRYGMGLYFDGNDDRVALPAGVLWDSSVPRSVEVWGFFGTIVGGAWPTAFTFQSDQATGFTLFGGNAVGYNGVNFGSPANFVDESTNDAGVLAEISGNWAHILLSYNGTGRAVRANYTLYLNATVRPTIDTGGFLACANISYLGQHPGGNTWLGPICGIRLYERVVSSAEVIQRYERCLKRADPMTHVWMIPWILAPTAATPMPILSTQGVHSAIHGGQIVR